MSFMHFDAHTAAAGVFSINLSGTIGSPREVTGFGTSDFGPPITASASWILAGVNVPGNSIQKGDMNKAGYNTYTPASYTSDLPATDWITDKDFTGLYWARGTLVDGDAPSFMSAADGVWYQIIPDTTSFVMRWNATGGYAIRAGTIQLDVARDVTGSPGGIIATGYYRGIAETEV